MMPDDNVLHKSIQTCSVPVGLLRLVLCELPSIRQYDFQRNSCFGGMRLRAICHQPSKNRDGTFREQPITAGHSTAICRIVLEPGSVIGSPPPIRILLDNRNLVTITFVSPNMTNDYSQNRIYRRWRVDGDRDLSMTAVERLAEFAVSAPYEELSETARQQLKIRILDALGCAIGAMDAEPPRMIRQNIAEFDANGKCTLLAGGRASPEHAAFHNGAAVRYLDFNDSYLAKGETCHPSDNLAPILAAAEYAGASGRDLMAALAVAYQVQCRLSDVAAVRAAGFDHTVQGAYAVAAGVARVLGLDAGKTANAIAISGTALNGLRVTRTGKLSHWKGLAYPHMAVLLHCHRLLARLGITGPLEVIEGEKGLMDAITGLFEIDWSREDLERVKRTILKKYNAEIHSQTAIEGVLALKQRHQFQRRRSRTGKPGDLRCGLSHHWRGR